MPVDPARLTRTTPDRAAVVQLAILLDTSNSMEDKLATAQQEIALIQYSSGSTGLQKGAALPKAEPWVSMPNTGTW